MGRRRRANTSASGSGGGRNHVSFWFWFLALFVMALPCIGWIMVVVWAFWGDNESRKNYFRAYLAWMIILTVFFAVFWIAIASVGFREQIGQFLHSHLPSSK